MAWLAKLFLTPAKWLWDAAVRSQDWLLDKPVRAILLLFALHVAAHQFFIDPKLRAERNKWQTASATWQEAAGKWQQAHDQVIANVRRQRARAAEMDRQNAARVEREQARVIEETKRAYQVDLADSRAAAEQLRQRLAHAAAAGGSDSGAAPVPGDFTARCRAFGAADCDALLAALPGQLTEAEENTNKLIRLQDWARGLLSIDMNGPGEQQ